MGSPPRLVIDLAGDWKLPKKTLYRAESEMVDKIRVGKHKNKVRIVIDLKDKGLQKPTIIQESPNGLTITL
jgi:hypothetical protein